MIAENTKSKTREEEAVDISTRIILISHVHIYQVSSGKKI